MAWLAAFAFVVFSEMLGPTGAAVSVWHVLFVGGLLQWLAAHTITVR